MAPLSGERDSNFKLRLADGSCGVLKLIDTTAGPAVIDAQARVLRLLAERDPELPVPRLLATSSGADVGSALVGGALRATLLIEFLPGARFDASEPSAALLNDLGRNLARMDRALRGFFHPGLNSRLAWDVRLLPELAAHAGLIGAPAARAAVERAVRAYAARSREIAALRTQAIHGDCHGSNLLMDAGADRVTGMLDFGDMIEAPLVFEPAVAMSELATEGLAALEKASEILRGYVAVQRLQAAEIDVLHNLIAARHATTVLVHAWRRRHDPSGASLVAAAAERAVTSLEALEAVGGAAWTRRWHEAAGTMPAALDLGRRRRQLLGAGAELFYEQPLELVRGEAVWLFDPAGRRYLDVYNNVAHVGHAHPDVVAAIARQSALLATHTRYLHESILEYAEQLSTRLPLRLDACVFVNSGSEANDLAWRLAQFATGRRGALVMQYAYHGITDAVAALSPSTEPPPDPRIATLAAPPAAAGVDRALRALHRSGFEPAAFYLDTGLTSSGIFDPAPAWAAAIAAEVRAAGALLIADEVQYGLARSGSHFWGFERRGFEPDIVTMGKPVGNGYPLGVLAAPRELIEKFQASVGFFSTFGGNPVAAAAGLSVLQVIERERLMARAQDSGAHLHARLQAAIAGSGVFGELRGAGLLQGLEVLGADAAAARARAKRIVNRLAREHGILTGTEGPGGNVLKLRPPLVFEREHAELLAAAIAAIAATET